MNPTDEQKDILKSAENMKTGDIMIVNALAGCAKTTTLKLIAEANPNSSFLYLAFNKSIVDDGKSKFPQNTRVSTLHGFARGYVGDKEIKNLNLDIIATILKQSISQKEDYFKAFNSLKAYQYFCKSNLSLKELDLLKVNIKKDMTSINEEKKSNNWLIKQRLAGVDNVEEIHRSILDADFTTFDTYMKDFVETSRDRTFKYDFIVLDESQDISKLLGKFMVSVTDQKRYKIIIVGDSNQKIYGFLGNLNISDVFIKLYSERVIRKTLSQSFRFMKGSKIENLSNKLLGLRGSQIFGVRDKLSDGNRKAYISRNTFPILAMAIYLIREKQDFNLYGGIRNFEVDYIKDIYKLYTHFLEVQKIYPVLTTMKNRSHKIDFLKKYRDSVPFPHIFSKSLAPFSSFLELEEFAETRSISTITDNLNIAKFIDSKKLDIHKIESKTDDLVDKFFNLILEHSNEASQTILSTIHKSKGMEFEDVTILRSLTLFFNDVENRWISHEPTTGYILGLNKVGINSDEDDDMSNVEMSNIFDTYGNEDSNVFTQKIIQQSPIDFTKVKHHKPKESCIEFQLVINEKAKDIKEEYNILYVGITRAINNIYISNINYLETLKFLSFINFNLDELIKIMENRESDLLVTVEKYNKFKKEIKTVEGIVYDKNVFIDKETLRSFLPNI